MPRLGSILLIVAAFPIPAHAGWMKSCVDRFLRRAASEPTPAEVRPILRPEAPPKESPSAPVPLEEGEGPQTEGPALLGYYRSHGDILPMRGPTPDFHSHRHISDPMGIGLIYWSPERKATEVPLWLAKPKDAVPLESASAYANLPQELRAIFGGGKILTTARDASTAAPAKSSPYSVLIPAARGESGPQGRTGLLMRKGKPVVVEYGGKKYLVEIKGVGTPDGKYEYGWKERATPIRGGALADQVAHELEVAKIFCKPGECEAFPVGGAVFRAPDGTEQGYLLRLVPSSVRGTFEGPGIPVVPDRVNRLSFAYGKLWGKAFSRGLVPWSHPENIVLSENGTRFDMTDFTDLVFAKEEWAFGNSIEDLSRQSLNQIESLRGYQRENFKQVRAGLIEALNENGHPEVAKEAGRAQSLTELGGILWQHLVKPAQFRQRRGAGPMPSQIEFFGSVNAKRLSDPNYFSKVVPEELRSKHAELSRWEALKSENVANAQRNLKENPTQRTLDYLEGERRELEKAKNEKQALENCGFDAKRCWKLTSYGIEIYAGVAQRRLESEIKNLEGYLPGVLPEEKTVVENSIRVGRARIQELKGLDPWQLHSKLLADPNYFVGVVTLPYRNP